MFFADGPKGVGQEARSNPAEYVDCISQELKFYIFLVVFIGPSPSGKAPGFDPGMRRFESCRPSQILYAEVHGSSEVKVL